MVHEGSFIVEHEATHVVLEPLSTEPTVQRFWCEVVCCCSPVVLWSRHVAVGDERTLHVNGVVCGVVLSVFTIMIVTWFVSVSVTLVLGTELVVLMVGGFIFVMGSRICRYSGGLGYGRDRLIWMHCWFRSLDILGCGRLVGGVVMPELKRVNFTISGPNENDSVVDLHNLCDFNDVGH